MAAWIVFLLVLTVPHLSHAIAVDSAAAARIDSLEGIAQSTSGLEKARLYMDIYELVQVDDNEGALSYAQEANRIARNKGDSTLQAESALRIGITTFFLGNFEEALQRYQEALDLFQALDKPGRASQTLNEMGTLVNKQGDIEKALSHFERALELSRAASDSMQIANSLNNMGFAYYKQQNWDKAMELYKESADLKERIGDINGLTYNLDNMGMVEAMRGDYEQSEQYFRRAIKLRRELGHTRGVGFLINNLGELYLMQNRYAEARELFRQALDIARQINYPDFQQHIYRMISETYQSQEQFAEALDYYKMHVQLKDSLFNAERSEQLQELQTKYETEKKEQQIALQQAEISQQQAQLQRNFILMGALVLLLALGSVIFYLGRSRQQKNHELALREAQMNASIRSQEAERKRFAQDLHDGMGQLISTCRLFISGAEKNGAVNGNPALKKSEEVLEQMHTEIRNIAFNIMPATLLQNGLGQAVQEFALRLNKVRSVEVEVALFEFEERLPEEYEISLYRIIQEWVNNVLKYSGAKHINVQLLGHEDEVVVMIEDDGQGFDTTQLKESKGNGWKNIQSRAELMGGTVNVDSRPDMAGTTMFVEVPKVSLGEISQPIPA